MTEPDKTGEKDLDTFLKGKINLEQDKDRTNLAESSGVALAVSSSLIAGIALTGVGLPVAGVLGIGLILTSIVIQKSVEMTRLKLTMLKVLGVLSKCYLLETLMVESRNLIENSSDPKLESHSDDAELINELHELINLIFSFIEYHILESLSTCDNLSIKEIALITMKKRSGLGQTAKGIYLTMSRAASSDWYQRKMLEKLSLLNAIFMLKYSRYNLAMDYYKSKNPTDYESKWKEIYEKEYFHNFVSGKLPLGVKQLTLSEQNTFQAAVKESYEKSSNEAPPSAGGTRRKKRKIKRKNKKRSRKLN